MDLILLDTTYCSSSLATTEIEEMHVLHGYTLFFLNFALKHILWVLIRTASMSVPTMYVKTQKKNNITIFYQKL